MADALQDRVVAALGDDYDVEAEIGRGGMAVVYRARDRRLRRLVAIKVLPPDLAFRQEIRSRFLREAETAAGLSHPHIVPIYSVGERDGMVFFVMGLVHGPSLAEVLHGDPRPPVARVREILRQTADALAYAHRHGVVHRDIKPDNILIDRETGNALVTDFGIARAAEAGQRLTQTGIAVGTPAYMSPEQAMGERDVDGRADLYSLGVVGYQMLAGRPPFEATSTPAMLVKHISEAPPSLAERRPDLPRNLVSAIERALSKGPDDRWPDAAAFRDALADDAIPVAAPRRHAPQEITPVGPARSGLSVGVAVNLPALPPVSFGGRRDSREARQAARDELRERARDWADDLRLDKLERRETRRELRRGGRPARSTEEDIANFHRHLIGSGTGILACWAVNLATSPHFMWAIFPTIGMGIGLVGHGAGIWSRGVSLKRIFSRQQLEEGAANVPAPRSAALPSSAGSVVPSAASVRDAAERLVSPEVLAGQHGRAVRHAVEDRAAMLAIIERLPAEDRALLPDVVPTVDALLERIATLATTLHRLSADVDDDALGRLDARLAALGEGGSPERERTRTLLQRQRASIEDLLGRRERLVTQLDSAGLALQNLKLDLLKLRSAGIGGALDEVTSATQQARALSRDIGHVLDAAAQVRSL